MRIITQDGNYDILYDNYSLTIDYSKDKKKYVLYAINVYNSCINELGNYSAEWKAKEAFDWIQHCYMQNRKYCLIPSDDCNLKAEE